MLYDGSSRIGGLAHILLPSEGLSLDSENRAKFPSTAIPLLVEEMRKRGAWGRPIAKIVGGASMFSSLLPSGGINMWRLVRTIAHIKQKCRQCIRDS